jgi:hypothetical protein
MTTLIAFPAYILFGPAAPAPHPPTSVARSIWFRSAKGALLNNQE